jgi:hypothetical protein
VEEVSEQARYQAGKLLDQINTCRNEQRAFESEAQELEADVLHFEALLREQEAHSRKMAIEVGQPQADSAVMIQSHVCNLQAQQSPGNMDNQAESEQKNARNCATTTVRAQKLNGQLERAQTESAVAIQAQVRRNQAGGANAALQRGKRAQEIHSAQKIRVCLQSVGGGGGIGNTIGERIASGWEVEMVKYS